MSLAMMRSPPRPKVHGGVSLLWRLSQTDESKPVERDLEFLLQRKMPTNANFENLSGGLGSQNDTTAAPALSLSWYVELRVVMS